jgi:catechol 2,3-dioxygenase-like lactoylglutathione lyase family enzyme
MNESVLTHAGVMGFVATTKPDEAKAFYGETLGLAFLGEEEYSLQFAVYRTMTLRVQKVVGLTPQPFTVFGWQVDDIGDAVTRLSEQGVTFEVFGFPTQDSLGICTFESGDKVAWFKDPDGNILSIAQIACA